MGVARQSQKKKAKKRQAKVVDLTGKTVYPSAGGTQKHFNFRPKDKDNRNGGLYVE